MRYTKSVKATTTVKSSISRLGRFGLLAAAIFLIFQFSQTVHAQTWELVWSDEFESDELNTEIWSFQTGTGANYGLINWGNNEQQFYTDREENLYLQDGKLHIRALDEFHVNRDYTSARIRTINQGDWTYGKFEVRAKLPEGQGLWPAIWMMPTDDVYGHWPQSGEIDIMELLGHEPNKTYGSVHYGPVWPNNQFRTGSLTLSEGSFSEDFHVFSIIWTEGMIRFFVDEQLYFLVTPNHLAPHHWPFDQDFHFLLNVAVGGHWPGYPDETTQFPQEMIVDYVRVYQDMEATSIGETEDVPGSVKLNQNYPNPFNPATQIEYVLDESGHVNLEVFNMMGQRVATLVNENKNAGSHTVTFDANNLASGMYLYRLVTDNAVLTRRMTLLK